MELNGIVCKEVFVSSELDTIDSFKGREDEKELFDFLLKRDEKWLLLFTGVSGIGKSTLLNWLIENRCAPGNIPYAKFDFEKIRVDFKSYYEYSLFLLDDVYRCIKPYLAHENIRKYEKKVEEISKPSDQKRILFLQIFTGSSSQLLHEDAGSIYENNAIRRLDAFFDCLEEDLQKLTVVFLCDTFEKASDEKRQWIFEFWRKFRDRGIALKVVIAMQEMASLSGIWGEALRHQLDNLSEGDIDTLFIERGVTDAGYRTKIYQEISHGHPLITNFAIELWRKSIAAGKPIKATDIPQEIYGQEKAVKWLNERMIERLEPSIQKIARWGVLLRSFDLEIINSLILQGEKELEFKEFEQFRELSFIEKSSPDEQVWPSSPDEQVWPWHFHNFMRKVMKKDFIETNSGKYEAFSERAYAYFIQKRNYKKKKIKQRYILEALYHHFQFAPEEALAEWNKYRREAKQEQDNDFWTMLIQLTDNNDEIILEEEAQKAFIKLKAAHFYRQRNQPEPSRVAYQEALKFYDHPALHTDQDARRAKHGFAALHLMQKNYKLANKWLEKLGGKESDDLSVLNLLATLEARLGHQKVAREIFDKILLIQSDNVYALNARANAELLWGNTDEAEHFIQKALEVLDNKPELEFPDNKHKDLTLTISVRLALARKDTAEATRLYEEIAGLSANSITSLYYRAIFEAKSQNPQMAHELFAQVRKLDPGYTTTTLLQLAIMEYSNDHVFARILFEKSLEGFRENVQTLEIWARLEWKYAYYGQAAALFGQIVSILSVQKPGSPELIDALFNCARLEGKQKDYENARQHFRDIIAIKQDYALAYAEWTIIEVRAKRYADADKLLKCALNLDKDVHTIMFSQANAENRKGIEEKRQHNHKEAQVHFDEAYALLKQVVSIKKSYVPALIELATMERERENYQEAEMRLKQALKVDHTHENIRYDFALIALMQGKLDLAVERFQKVLELKNLSLSVKLRTYRKWASTELRRKNYEQGQFLFKKAYQLDTDNINTLLRWIQFEHEVPDEQEVNRLIELALRTPIDNVRWIIALARTEVRHGNIEHARDLFAYGERERPSRPLINAYAQFEEKEKQYDRASQLYEAAHFLDPTNAVILAHRAIMEYKCGRIAEAQSLFRHSLTIDHRSTTDRVETLRVWARLEWSKHHYQLAAQLFAEIVELEPDNVNALWNRGCLERKSGHLQTAYECFQQAVKIEPDHARSLLELAKIEQKWGNQSEANTLFERAKSVAPDRLHIQALEAMSRKNYDLAREKFDALLKKNPHHVPILLHRAYLDIKQRKFQDAETALLHILDVNPDHIPALDELAKLAKYHHDYDAAIDYLNTLLTIDDTFILNRTKKLQIFRRLAEMLWEKGCYQEARMTFEKALTLTLNNAYTFLRWARREREIHNEAGIQTLIERVLAQKKIDDTRWIITWANEENWAGHTDNARRLLKYVSLCRADFSLFKTFALFEFQEQNYQLALQFFEQASQLQTLDANSLTCWAISAYKCGCLDAAREIFQQSLTIEFQSTSDMLKTLQLWATLEREQHCYEQAVRIFADIILLEPENIEALRHLTILEEKLGKPELAHKRRQKILSINSNYTSIIEQWTTDEQFRIDQAELSVWKTLDIGPAYRHLLPATANILAVFSTPLFFVQGSARLRFTQKLKHTALHRFMARCLLELAPCTTKQLTDLLSLRDPELVDVLIQPFLINQNVLKDQDGYWHVQNAAYLQCIAPKKGQEVQDTLVEFICEWKHGQFLPRDIQPQQWEGIENLDLDLQIKVPAKQRALWAKTQLNEAVQGSITWQEIDYTQAWFYPLKVIVYQNEDDTQPLWLPITPQPEVLKYFETIAQKLRIKQQITNMQELINVNT